MQVNTLPTLPSVVTPFEGTDPNTADQQGAQEPDNAAGNGGSTSADTLKGLPSNPILLASIAAQVSKSAIHGVNVKEAAKFVQTATRTNDAETEKSGKSTDSAENPRENKVDGEASSDAGGQQDGQEQDSAAGNGGGTFASTVLQLTQSAINGAKKAAESVGNSVEKAAENVGNSVEKAAENVGNGVEKAAKSVGNAVEETAKSVSNVVVEAVETEGSGVEKAAESLGNGVEKAAENLGNGVKKAAESLGNGFEEAAKSDGFEKAVESLGNGVVEAAENLGNGVEKAAISVQTAADAATEELGQSIDSTEKFVENKVDDGRTWLRQNGGLEGQELSDEIGLVEGAGVAVYDAGKGIVQLTYGAGQLANPVEWAANPQANIGRLKSAGNAAVTLGRLANLATPEGWALDPQGNAQLASALWNSAATSFEKDPSKFIGNLVGTVGTMFIPGGGEAAAVGDVARGTEVLNDASKAVDVVTTVEKADQTAGFLADASTIRKGTSSAVQANLAKIRLDTSLSEDDRIFAQASGQTIAKNPVASHSYARLQEQGTDVVYINDPDFGSAGLWEPWKNRVTVNMAEGGLPNETTSTLIHEAAHQTRYFRGFNSSKYEEYFAFRREALFNLGRRPTLTERQSIWDGIGKIPAYQKLPTGNIPRFIEP